MTDRFLGLDLGTSSVKGLLVGDDGTILGRHSSAYPTANPRPGHAEQDLADWTAAVADVVAHLVPDGRVDGVGIAGHTPSLVAVGADRRAVRPCLTWQDVRAVADVPRPVTLAAVKAEPRLATMSLVTSFRLSVQPVTPEEWAVACEMGGCAP